MYCERRKTVWGLEGLLGEGFISCDIPCQQALSSPDLFTNHREKRKEQEGGTIEYLRRSNKKKKKKEEKLDGRSPSELG
jgi:hypothetical protein